jgi:hypothetical protein
VKEEVEEMVKEEVEEMVKEEVEEMVKEEVEEMVEEMVKEEVETKVMLYCNWTSSKDLCDCWNKMSKGNYTWNNIRIVWEEPADYYVIINCPPPGVEVDLSRTIMFEMEPYMSRHPEQWGEWADPSDELLFKGTHANTFNNNEWHLSKTYSQLSSETITKDDSLNKTVSAVLSDKYKDPGQISRIDFAQFLDNKDFPLHVFGGNKFGWNNYKGSPPLHAKDEAILPYKYTFNAENNIIPGYFSEKLIDGILGETLVFYHGAPDIREHINPKAFVWLELSNFEEDYRLMCQAIEQDWWSDRIEYIREEKKRILNNLQFFPRIEAILNKTDGT